MSSPSELSRILTNANLTMYPAGSPEPMQSTLSVPTMQPNMDTLQLSDNTFSCGLMASWYDLNPQYWTKQHVLEWIGFHVDGNKFDASTLNMAYCTMDGHTLCQLTRDQLYNIFGSLGAQLHQSLFELKAKYDSPTICGTDLSETCKLLDNFLQEFPDFPLLSTLKVGEVVRDSDNYNDYNDFSHVFKTLDQLTPNVDEYDSDSMHSSSSGGLHSLQNPSSPESRSSDSDPEFSYPQIAKVQIKTEKGEKRGRGRPPKHNREPGQFYETSKKSKHAPRGSHLWEFIRDILIHPEQNQGLMKWEDRREGVFKFLKSEAVANLWGQKKKNSSMTYEKLSRAMRYYYKREILERVDGRRLVYKFGKNASGWKMEESGLKM